MRPGPRSALSFVSAIVASLAAAATAPAQTVEVSDFTVATPTFEEHVSDPDVAVGADGTILFVWGEYGDGGVNRNIAVSRHFTAAGIPLGPPTRIDTSKHVSGPELAAAPGGGYVVVWPWIKSNQDYALFGQRLDADGHALGPDFQVDFANGGSTVSGAATALASGSVYVWRQLGKLWMRRYDAGGTAAGAPSVVAPGSGAFDLEDVVALPDGGFAVVWTQEQGEYSAWARAYDADGTPRGDGFPLAADLIATRAAVSPLGALVAVGIRENAGDANFEPWIVRFTADGTVLGEHRAEVPNTGVVPGPDVAVDAHGLIYVAWSEYQAAGVLLPPRARGFDPSGTPLAPGFWVTTDTTTDIRTAMLSDGRFVSVWIAPSGRVKANVVSVPPPGDVVCGDGILAAGFEDCDDGAANSDTVPDACRTNCLRARCGDGVADAGETCDDGNTRSCDGCDARCAAEPGPVCGDGILSPGCEQCDDGGLDAGDGCDGTCTLERIPGGGSPATDCRLEWVVDNPSNQPRFDRRGRWSADQRCTDGDTACDRDPAAGACAFAVRLCANNRTATLCTPAPLAAVDLRSPSAKQALRTPAYAGVRAAVIGAAAALVGATAPDACSEPVEVAVPLRGSPGTWRDGKLKLKALATATDGVRDKDTLKLTCAAP